MTKGVKLKNKNGEVFYPASYMPIGAIISLENSIDPSTIYGGTWSLISNQPNRIYVGSSILYSSITITSTDTIPLYGAYEYTLFNGVFTGTSLPSGYHREYRLSALITNNNGADAIVMINSKELVRGCTYSNTTFRKACFSDYFKESDLKPLEPPQAYSTTGCLLKVKASAATTATISEITIHGYLVSDKNIRTWKRIK